MFCYIQAEEPSLVSQAERFSISAWPLSSGLVARPLAALHLPLCFLPAQPPSGPSL